MKILLVMDPGILVPPKGYGGHERLVYMFAREYQKMGHEVHLLVTTGSEVENCTVHPFGKERFPQQPADVRNAIVKAWQFLWHYRNDFDLIHNFGRLMYLLPILNHPVKKIMTYGREINARNASVLNQLPHRNIIYTGCSTDLIKRSGAKGLWKTVYNAIDFSKYQLVEKVADDAPLIFLGRVEKVKGCHVAIQVAKKTNNRLIIAGNISPLQEEQQYFREEIQPYIDGKQVTYVGQVNDEQKSHFLGQAKALVFPIEWNEPFGIVMIEAMACGTPVVAFNRGSVNEVIDEGITGLKVNTIDEMAAAVDQVRALDRSACRRQAAARFSAGKIAREYLDLFNEHKKKKIAIVTTGQPAANPRVVKEYEALKEEGYDVKVLYTYSAEWSYQIDEAKFANGSLDRNDFILAGGDPHNGKIVFFLSRIYFRVFRWLMNYLPFTFFKNMAIARAALPLWIRAVRCRADVYIAHYVGALPAAAKAARAHKAALVFDAEDYHRGEAIYYPGQQRHISGIEDRYLPEVSYITAASPMISAAYQRLYPDKKVITLNNVFSKKYIQHLHPNGNGTLKLFWFSQYIGPNRGLEIIIDAVNLIESDISLYLLGNAKNPDYLQSLLKKVSHPERVHLLKPVDPENIFKVVANYDVGLASEVPHCENRNICLTNKIFTYLIAGSCVLASDTDAQKQLLDKYRGVGLVYKYNDPQDLAEQIKRLMNDKQMLASCKNNALHLVEDELNWEKERQKLYAVISEL